MSDLTFYAGRTDCGFVVAGDIDDDGTQLYWSNLFGWAAFEQADIFTYEQTTYLMLPIGGMWVPLHPIA